ncbi:MAG: hypothetical protein NUV91_02840 [Candidatus Omnitrophica bacterium]|nr:hypothetical protein [Candidatus Omnitrophota bacterium]
MQKKNQKRSKRPSAKRQAAKALGGHIRARNRAAARYIMAA